LTTGAINDFQKVKNIHDWVADNISYDIESYLSENIPDQSFALILKNKSSVCEGYSHLFQKMCELVDIDCIIINGYARGYGYDIFDVEDVNKPNHAWNAINIEDKWYFVDVTWDAGYVDANTYIKRYSTSYLYLAPEKMIYSHHPNDVQWQLLNKPVTEEEFLSLPYFEGMLFSYGIYPNTYVEKITEVNNAHELEFTINENAAITTEIIDEHNNRYSAFVQQREGIAEITIRFPHPGRWTAVIFAMNRGDTRSTSCGKLGFISSSSHPKSFPMQYATFHEHNCYLHSPLSSPLETGSEEKFEITIPGAESAAIVIDGEWTFLDRVEEGTDLFSVGLTIPETDQLNVYGRWNAEGRYHGILAYDVR